MHIPVKRKLDQSKNWVHQVRTNYTGYFTCLICILKQNTCGFALDLSQNLSTHSIFLHCSIYVRRTKVVLFPAERKITKYKTSLNLNSNSRLFDFFGADVF